MSDRIFGILDGAVVLVVVVGLAVWQLVSVNREIGRDQRKADPGKAESPQGGSPERSGHPIGEHRLDDR